MLVFVDNGTCGGQTYLSAATDVVKDQEVGNVTWWEAGEEDETLFRLKLEINIPVVSPLSFST